jgi:CubicO group peptidase (beta-lactamase class C family)
MMAVWRLDPEVDPARVGVDAAVLDAMVRSFADQVERGELFAGAQMAMYRAGRKVLDVGGGIARVRTNVPVTPDTLFVIFSSTKGMAALAMWMLHERGRFDFDDPVVKYWPEFAAIVPEKARVTIRHIMGHRGGFPTGPEWLTARHWGDRAAIRRAMEEVPLAWTPGEACGYHALNFGWMINELVERTDPRGRDPGRFLAEEVFAPLGIDEAWVGLPDDEALEARVAWFYEPREILTALQAAGVVSSEAGAGEAAAPAAAGRGQPRTRATDTPELSEPFNRPAVHRAVIPAGGGIATARALAKMYAPLALGGELDGVRLLRRESLEAAIVPTTRPGEVDRILRVPMRWGTGWHMGGQGEGSSARTFGHGGRGGQSGFADLDRGLAFAFVTTGQLKATAFLEWRLALQGMAFRACRD